MTIYECLTLLVGGLALAISSLTLWVLYRTLCRLKDYADDTKRLADTAVEQLPQPYVVLKRFLDYSVGAVMNFETTSLSPDKDYGRPLIFWNVGSGIAVNCRFRIIDMDQKTLKEPPTWRIFEIEPSKRIKSTCTLNSVPENAKVVIEYESVTGTPYQTDVRIADQKWVKEMTRSKP